MKCNIILFNNGEVRSIVSEITDQNYYISKENQKLVYHNITNYLKELVDKKIIKSIRIPKPRNKGLKYQIDSLFNARKTIKKTLRQLYDYFE